MYGQLYRKILLPLFETHLKGRRTLEYWAEAEETQWWTREQLESLQRNALVDLLEHASRHCSWYADRWRDAGFAPESIKSVEDIQQLPLLTRDDIIANRERMRSDDGRELSTKATGGSSGQPLQFDLDARTAEKRVAMTHRGYGWAGAAPGSKQLFIWGSHVGQVPLWKRWKAALHHRFDRHRMISCFDFTPERMRDAYAVHNRYRPEVIVAYTNPVYEFARFMEEERMQPFSPNSIVVGAEKLHDYQREQIERVFNCPVFETYGSREFMLIGAECEQHSGLHLSMDNLLVEILDDDGQPTPAGEEGNVVITDLYNYGMPFIRYVNGDRAIAGFEECSCGRGLPLLKKVTGRQLDVLETPDGRKVPGEFFPHLLKEYAAIRRFQVLQSDPSAITLRLVTDDRFDDAIQADMLAEVRKCTGEAVHLEVELVDEIPLTRAGKLKVVVKTEAASPAGVNS